MGHLLSSVNPEAAAKLSEFNDKPEPAKGRLPGVGELVVYHPRPGEFRRGRAEFPALVMGNDPERHTVHVVVFYDRDDSHAVDNVPAWDGVSLGWTLPKHAEGDIDLPDLTALTRIAALEAEIELLKGMLVGQMKMPENESVLGILNEHEDRIDVLETNGREHKADIKQLNKALKGAKSASKQE